MVVAVEPFRDQARQPAAGQISTNIRFVVLVVFAEESWKGALAERMMLVMCSLCTVRERKIQEAEAGEEEEARDLIPLGKIHTACVIWPVVSMLLLGIDLIGHCHHPHREAVVGCCMYKPTPPPG